MKNIRPIILVSIILLYNGCITQFIPQTTEEQELLVVEGLITDKPDVNTIKLSRPSHLGTRNVPKPVSGCIVKISDDSGQSFDFNETAPGIYTSDPSEFQGIIGRFYTLHINTDVSNNNLNYESLPTELKPVPPIDSIYFEKITFQVGTGGIPVHQGCQIFLDTHDPSNQCKFYRWEYSETWEFHIPYTVPNNICWLSNSSNVINIKNTSVFEENIVKKYPINLVTNITDRLSVKYSILINQYSLNEDEFLYWEKLQNISEQVGGLYDMIPSAIPSNVYCVNDPNEKVLGYFSVSAKSSERIFINGNFAGIFSPYTTNVCVDDTVYGSGPIRNLGLYVWVIVNTPLPPPGYRVTTRIKDCYDCTLRGTNIEPDFWKDAK